MTDQQKFRVLQWALALGMPALIAFTVYDALR